MSHPINRPQLVAILSRMSSDHDGEAANAARMATRMVQKAGLSWDDLIQLPERTTAPRAAAEPVIIVGGMRLDPPHNGSWIQTVLFLIRHAASPTSRIPEDHRRWLLERGAAWRTKAMRPDEAVRVSTIYAALMAPAGGHG